MVCSTPQFLAIDLIKSVTISTVITTGRWNEERRRGFLVRQTSNELIDWQGLSFAKLSSANCGEARAESRGALGPRPGRPGLRAALADAKRAMLAEARQATGSNKHPKGSSESPLPPAHPYFWAGFGIHGIAVLKPRGGDRGCAGDRTGRV